MLTADGVKGKWQVVSKKGGVYRGKEDYSKGARRSVMMEGRNHGLRNNPRGL
jgi:hypothetical protein